MIMRDLTIEDIGRGIQKCGFGTKLVLGLPNTDRNWAGPLTSFLEQEVQQAQ